MRKSTLKMCRNEWRSLCRWSSNDLSILSAIRRIAYTWTYTHEHWHQCTWMFLYFSFYGDNCVQLCMNSIRIDHFLRVCGTWDLSRLCQGICDSQSARTLHRSYCLSSGYTLHRLLRDSWGYLTPSFLRILWAAKDVCDLYATNVVRSPRSAQYRSRSIALRMTRSTIWFRVQSNDDVYLLLQGL